MFEIIKAGGWVMVPIIACSILALAIILERFWTLRATRIIPPQLVPEVWNQYRKNRLDTAYIRRLKANSPLGAVLAAGLVNYSQGREVVRESIEQAGRQVIHDLERYLNTLGTIASVSPYLGLLGSVLGMIKVFSTFSMASGIGNPTKLAGGISEILIATAAGLAVAIPSLIFYRYFQGRVIDFAVRMEEEAVRLIETLYSSQEEE
ncbi:MULTISPECIES: MotA/TolQ/ExbB proton channel family protein [Methylocaldum]|jgi:biopolymer transport protein ExbB|uniref:MotA/TolQ/ExbB proton channel family protein n=1 Tax=unclassified Methylocaldum TaxID=2622260 RepID=UPI000989B798|nr:MULTISPECIES: MotA/TolQ/ExbB proton channel family protein [unclassified Methylocaldum]MBP1150769.1 biopolymer transport protein ExbB [Methylocaldum sp. RMAD-M]MDV3242420.1 MotA/TolQ/ExbB proton channel family protein [Methylocaldum sp.]MVF22965.1 MotA/TolQ/ExbB proton channel family protein [Methylocaldum sp. BRCS4]